MHDLNCLLDKIEWGYKTGSYNALVDQVEVQRLVKAPKISIVMISWQFNKQIEENFKSLEKQRQAGYELIFVNNGKPDEEFACILPFVDTYIRLNTNSGAYKARNIGAVFANAPILFFLEDDGIAHKDLVESHLKAFEKYKVISVRGVCKALTDNKLNSLARHYYLGSKPFPFYANLEGNSSYDAQAFYAVGGWNDDINFGHGGPELSYRLTKKFSDKREQIYFPEPIIYHDYAKGQEHLESKRKKQNMSYNHIKAIYPDFDVFVTSWHRYYQRPYLLKRRNNNFFSYVEDQLLYCIGEPVILLINFVRSSYYYRRLRAFISDRGRKFFV